MASRRVLLVGADPEMVPVFSEYLRRGDRYDVTCVDYCDDALQALSQQPFALMLLLSIFARWRTLPSQTAGFGGIELLRQMRVVNIHVPVVVVSASTREDAKREALANGALDFIHPLYLDELGEALKRIHASG